VTEPAANDGNGSIIVGVLADPEAAPAQIGLAMRDELPEVLAQRLDGSYQWDVEVRLERLPAGSSEGHFQMMETAARRREAEGWDLVVCLTDLPIRHGRQPLVADTHPYRRVGLVCLPAFGALFLKQRVRTTLVQVVALLWSGTEAWRVAVERDSGRLPKSLRWTTDDELDGQRDGAQMVANFGSLRLLAGMVRDNRPWQLLPALTSGIAGAFALSAFYLINSGVWELAQALGFPRLVLILVASVTAMVVWLILGRSLWERSARIAPQVRSHLKLLNAATVITLLLGVLAMAAMLFVVNLTAAALLISGDVLVQFTDGEVTPGAYLRIGWLTSAAAIIAGAIGSGFESDEAVREAVYSFRERQRRAAAEEAEEAKRAEEAEASPESPGH